MKVLISILSYHDNDIYSRLEDTIRNTWYVNNDNIKTIFYHGKQDIKEAQLNDDELYLPLKENYNTISLKTLKMYEYLYGNFKDYDYVFRTNLSSYVNTNKLLNFLKNKPKENFYCGINGYSKKFKVNFASGSGYFLSWDLINKIYENKHLWDIGIIDDLALAKVMKNIGISIYEGAERIDLKFNEENIYKSSYHYRCKFLDNREKDIEYIKKLHGIYGKEINNIYN